MVAKTAADPIVPIRTDQNKSIVPSHAIPTNGIAVVVDSAGDEALAIKMGWLKIIPARLS